MLMPTGWPGAETMHCLAGKEGNSVVAEVLRIHDDSKSSNGPETRFSCRQIQTQIPRHGVAELKYRGGVRYTR